jgi:hypothetical protein
MLHNSLHNEFVSPCIISNLVFSEDYQTKRNLLFLELILTIPKHVPDEALAESDTHVKSLQTLEHDL